MPEPASLGIAALITGLGAGASAILGNQNKPSSPAPPDTSALDAEARADAARRRALATSGRASTLLVDDTETPLSQQINPVNIGKSPLLGEK